MRAEWGFLQEFSLDMRADLGDDVLIDFAREGFQRICERDAVTPVGEPIIECAVLPAMDWDDPLTGETLHIPERWAVRMLVDVP